MPIHEHGREEDPGRRAKQQEVARLRQVEILRLASFPGVFPELRAEALGKNVQILQAAIRQLTREGEEPDAETPGSTGAHEPGNEAVPGNQCFGQVLVAHAERIGLPDEIPDGDRTARLQRHDLEQRGWRITDRPQVANALLFLEPPPAGEVLVHDVAFAILAEPGAEEILHDRGKDQFAFRTQGFEQLVVRQTQLGHDRLEVRPEDLRTEPLPLVVAARPVDDVGQRALVSRDGH